MDVRAAVAFAPGKPLEVTTVKLEGPRAARLSAVRAAGPTCPKSWTGTWTEKSRSIR